MKPKEPTFTKVCQFIMPTSSGMDGAFQFVRERLTGWQWAIRLHSPDVGREVPMPGIQLSADALYLDYPQSPWSP